MCSDTLPFMALRLALIFFTPHSTIPTSTDRSALMTAPVVNSSITHSLLYLHPATTNPPCYCDRTSCHRRLVPTGRESAAVEARGGSESAEGRGGEPVAGIVDLGR